MNHTFPRFYSEEKAHLEDVESIQQAAAALQNFKAAAVGRTDIFGTVLTSNAALDALNTACYSLPVVRKKLLPAMAQATLRVLQKQLGDYLGDGPLSDPSLALLSTTSSVPTHNIGNERLQGMLDYQKRRAPNATARSVEAKVSYRSNHTGQYINNTTAARQRHLILTARHFSRKAQRLKVAREQKVQKERYSRRQTQTQKKENRLKNQRTRALEQLCRPGGTVPADADLRAALPDDISQAQFKFVYDCICNPMSLLGKSVRQYVANEDGSQVLMFGKLKSVTEKKGKYPKYNIVCNFANGDVETYSLGSVLIDYVDGDMTFINSNFFDD